MSIDEYIAKDFPFYHIAKMENLESIKRSGLLKSKSKSRNAICVVRTSDDDIINEIIDCQLHTIDEPDNTLYALIKIIPKKHGITADVVSQDPIDEENSSLYNYLCVDSIAVQESDIIKINMPIGRFRGYKCLKDVVSLTNYHIAPPPVVENIDI